MTKEGIIDSTITRAPFQVFDRKPPPTDLQAEVLRGLSSDDKRLSPKFFYDQAGSRLFEAITRLPEYYLTRTELGIFDEHMAAVARRVEPDSAVVEYGSGSSLKIRKVLEEVSPQAYVPVDISGEHMVDMARDLADDFPELAIYPTCADFTSDFELPLPVADLSKVGFFPGSSIGNFDRTDARAFLGQVCRTLGSRGQLIIGVDLNKDVGILEAAYNDAAGVTAAFNLNLLAHLAELLDADLVPSRFRHRAVFNETLGAIQMFLDVAEAHEVVIGNRRIRFEQGESIHTENSFKYHPDEFLDLAGRAGFEQRGMWTDERGWYAVFLLEAGSC
jgi:dimethylhistidine N-methyltransferase